MDTTISPLGYSITLATLPPHFLQIIKEQLYVKPLENPMFSKNVDPYPIFRISKTKIYLPRFYAQSEYSNAKNNLLPDGEPIELDFHGELREVQQKTITSTLDAYEKYSGGLISLDTGLGKTVVALNLISKMKLKTLILVHADFLVEQWVERIGQYLPTARVGIIRQAKCDYQDKDICIGMIQSIVSRDYPKECFRTFGHLIIDEVHHIGSRTFSSIFFKVQTKYMLGMSATPERKDGLSKVIYWFLGPQIVHFKRETNKPSIVTVKYTDAIPDQLNVVGKVNCSGMITALTEDQKRNDIIVELVRQYTHETTRKILILSERRNHCEYLNERISQFVTSGVYLGGMKSESRNISKNCRVIVGTYQASGEGFDVPELDTLIMATPKSDVEQAVGRILRQKNENDPIVIDLFDAFSIFQGQYQKRKKYYISAGFMEPGPRNSKTRKNQKLDECLFNVK